MHRWPFAVVVTFAVVSFAVVAFSACGGSSSEGLDSPTDSARAAMLDVRVRGCGPNVGFGTATLIDDALAVTAAHVVAGADTVSVLDIEGNDHDARVVMFDPDQDIAALLVPFDIATPVAMQPPDADDADRGVISVSRGAFDDREVSTMPVEIPRHVNVATTDIYLEHEVLRPGFEVTGDIEPGDSGSMIIGPDGAIGVLWSRSTTATGRAWAVDVPDDLRRAAAARSLDKTVDTGPCIR